MTKSPAAASAMNPSVVHRKNATTCGNVPESANTLAIAARSAVARAGAFVTGWTAASAAGNTPSRLIAR